MADDTGLPIQKKVVTPNYVVTEDAPTEMKSQKNIPEDVVTVKQPPKKTDGWFKRNVTNPIADTYSNVKENAKKTITFENGKTVLVNTVKNVSNNLKNDAGYLGNQTKSSMKNIGLIEKQSVKKYGDTQYPTLFGGEGGYFNSMVSDKETKTKIKQVSSFDQKKNNIDIFASHHPKQNPSKSIDVFATPKQSKKKKDKGINIKVQPNNIVNSYSNSFSDLHQKTSHNKNAMLDIFAVSKKNKSQRKDLSSDMNNIFNTPLFGGKKKKRGLF